MLMRVSCRRRWCWVLRAAGCPLLSSVLLGAAGRCRAQAAFLGSRHSVSVFGRLSVSPMTAKRSRSRCRTHTRAMGATAGNACVAGTQGTGEGHDTQQTRLRARGRKGASSKSASGQGACGLVGGVS